jgi:hypothetical protein
MVTAETHQFRPSRLWKLIPPDRRLEAARAFWADAGDASSRAQATDALARHLNFRHKSVVALADERKARYLATLTTIPDSLAAHLLVAYHLATQRTMMSAFLDALGIAHDSGLITTDQVAPPEPARLQNAARDLFARFPHDDVALYLATLVSQDAERWGMLKTALPVEH